MAWVTRGHPFEGAVEVAKVRAGTGAPLVLALERRAMAGWEQMPLLSELLKSLVTTCGI